MSSADTSLWSEAPDPFDLALDELDADQIDHLTDPVGWVDIRLGEHTWSKQVEILNSVRDHPRTAVKSCHGVGKSHTASRIAGWWLDAHPPGEAFVVSTAPTFSQVKAVLWRYIRQMHRKGLDGRVNQTEWYLDDEIVAYGRKPADHDEAAFQGIHARYVLVIIDEASGVPDQLWVAASALTTNDDCRTLAIGNPADPLSHFAKVCQPGSGWNVIGISAFDSPNFTDEQVPERLGHLLISQAKVDEWRTDFGEDSPLWSEKVLGEFPADATDQVVRSGDLARCQLPRDVAYTADDLLPVVLGVDVGGGGDETVVRERRGRMAGREWRDRNDDTMTVVALVEKAQQTTGATVVNVDSIGIGAGVADRLAQLHTEGKFPAKVNKVNVGTASRDPKRFANLRAEIWWEIGRLLSEHRGWDLTPATVIGGLWQQGMENAGPACAQLLSVKWSTDASGRIVIEKKEDVIARIGRSPDNADALLLAFYRPVRGGFVDFMDQFLASASNPAPSAGPAVDVAALSAS